MKATDGTPKWVFITAHDCYLIGHMTPQGFVAEQEMQRLNQPGGIYYAAQTFANMPNDRVIRMAWHILNAPAKHFSQQMSIPAELTLYRDANGYRLAMLPVRELDAQTVCALQASETVAGEKTWAILPTAADVRLKFAEDAELTVTLFGRTIAISAGQNTVTCEGRTVPLSVSGEEKNLRIICDRCSMELFADSGRICLAVRAIQDTSVPTLRLQTEQPQNIQIAVYHNR